MLLSGLLALTLAATPPTGSSVSPPTVPAQDDAPLRIARTGPAAELDLARHLVRASRTEEALAHLDLLLAGVEDPASDPGLAALSRERGRVAGLLDLRDSHLAKLAAEKGRLRIPVDGKHRNLKVAGYDEGVISFAQNKYDIEFLTVDELALEDLARAFKNGKVMPLELRSYALALAGDRTWNKVWGPDLDPPAQHLADLDDAEASADRGAKVEALRELEDFLGQDPGRKEGERIVALVEAVWPEGQVALDEDDGRHRFRALRDLVTAGLEASFGPAALPSILHAQAAEMRGEELWLRYDFADEEQLLDWQRDESHLPEVRMIGLLQTPDEEHRIGIVDGALEVLGVKGLRFVLPYHGPLRLRYGMQLPKVGEPDLLWQILVYLHDDLDKNRFVVHCFAYWIELLDLNFPKELERDQVYYEIGKDYFVELVVDRKSDLTARREDLADEHTLVMPSRRVNRGFVRIGTLTDYPTRITSFELQGTPDMAQLDLFRGAWVDERLDELGF